MRARRAWMPRCPRTGYGYPELEIDALRTLAVGRQAARTGLFKRTHHGARCIERCGPAADASDDRTRHGGEKQKTLAFSTANLASWSRARCGRFEPGLFGEDMTLDQWWSAPRPVDRLMFDEVCLRTPFSRPFLAPPWRTASEMPLSALRRRRAARTVRPCATARGTVRAGLPPSRPLPLRLQPGLRPPSAPCPLFHQRHPHWRCPPPSRPC